MHRPEYWCSLVHLNLLFPLWDTLTEYKADWIVKFWGWFLHLRFKDCAYCCIASKILAGMKVIICFQVTHQLSLLGPHRHHWNRKWGLPSCQCLPVNMLKRLANDTTLLLRISNCTKRIQPHCNIKSQSVFLSHFWNIETQQHACLFPLPHSQSHTTSQLVSVLVCWNLVFPACHSCCVFLLSLSAHTATKTGLKLNEGNKQCNTTWLGLFLILFLFIIPGVTC